MEIMSLVYGTLCLLACAFCVYACYRHVADANEVANDLRNTRARLIATESYAVALEGKQEKLLARLKVLEGRFYAERGTPTAALVTKVTEARPACENWLQALQDGPRSEAASCECDYCTEQRAQRAREKAAILALHQRGAPRRNGGE